MSEYHDKKYPQSEASDLRLRELSSTGLSIEETAKRMHLPQEVVSKWRKRLGIKVRENSYLWNNHEAVDALRSLWPVPGKSASDIADVIAKITGRKKVSRNCIMGKAYRLGLGEKPRRGTGNFSVFSGVTTIAPPTGCAAARNRATARPPKAVPTPTPAPQMVRVLIPGAAPKMVEKSPEPQTKRVNLLALTPTMCRWPIGDPQSENFHFCGCDTGSVTATYCTHHSRIAYQPVQRRRQPDMVTVAA
jgi:GcrA cell cycle regulator